MPSDVQMNLAIRPAGTTADERARRRRYLHRPSRRKSRRHRRAMQRFDVAGTKLTVISNRGTKVWPNGNPDTYWSDHWSCRFESDGSELFTAQHVVQLLERGRPRRLRRDQNRRALHVQRRARLLVRTRRVRAEFPSRRSAHHRRRRLARPPAGRSPIAPRTKPRYRRWERRSPEPRARRTRRGPRPAGVEEQRKRHSAAGKRPHRRSGRPGVRKERRLRDRGQSGCCPAESQYDREARGRDRGEGGEPERRRERHPDDRERPVSHVLENFQPALRRRAAK